MRKTLLAAVAALLLAAPAFANGNHGPSVGGAIAAGGISGSGAAGIVFAAPGGTVAAPNAGQLTITGNSGINVGLDGTRIVANGYHALEMTAIAQGNAFSLGAGGSFDLTGVGGFVGFGW